MIFDLTKRCFDPSSRASAERMIKLAKPKLRPAEIMTQDSQKESPKQTKPQMKP